MSDRVGEVGDRCGSALPARAAVSMLDAVLAVLLRNPTKCCFFFSFSYLARFFLLLSWMQVINRLRAGLMVGCASSFSSRWCGTGAMNCQ